MSMVVAVVIDTTTLVATFGARLELAVFSKRTLPFRGLHGIQGRSSDSFDDAFSATNSPAWWSVGCNVAGRLDCPFPLALLATLPRWSRRPLVILVNALANWRPPGPTKAIRPYPPNVQPTAKSDSLQTI